MKVLQLHTDTGMISGLNAGWSSLAAHRAHNPKVAGSNPAPATSYIVVCGPMAHFFYFDLCVDIVQHLALEKLVTTVIEDNGYEFVGLEYLPHGKQVVLRIFIDHATGVSVNDCQKVSSMIYCIIGVETNLLRGDATLEVSSPGLDRKLFTFEQCVKHIGVEIKVHLKVAHNGRQNFQGVLRSAKEGILYLVANGSEVEIAFAAIQRANVVPKW